MTKLPEAVIEAAKTFSEIEPPDQAADLANLNAELRFRRVILALAEEMPADAVENAILTLRRIHNVRDLTPEDAAEAITAFLKHVAGDTP